MRPLLVLGILLSLMAEGQRPKTNRELHPDGRVVDILTGRGIPGVEITSTPITRGEQPIHLVSNPDGTFPFPFQSLTISVRKPGYREISAIGSGGNLAICCEWDYDIHERPLEGPFYYSMMPLGEISAVVKDAAGNAVANRSILVERAGANSLDRDKYGYEEPRQIDTDQQGRFRLQLDAVDTEFFTQDEACGSSLLARIPVTPGANPEIRLTIPSRRLHTIRGRVRNSVPPSDFQEIVLRLSPVLLYPGCSGDRRQVLTRSGGAFSISGVPPGNYVLSADLQPRCDDDLCQGPVWTANRQITVAGKELRNVQIAIFPNLKLRIATHLEGSQPEGWSRLPEVYLAGDSGAAVGRKLSSGDDAQRSFVISDVQPGRYSLRFRNALTVPYLREIRLNGKLASVDSLVLTDRPDENQLDLYFSGEGANLQVCGVDQNGQPLRRYTPVIFQRREGPFRLLSPQGNVLEPGEYFVFVVQPDLPVIAIRPEIVSRYVDRAIRVSLKAGQDIKLELPAIEDHPLAPRPL